MKALDCSNYTLCRLICLVGILCGPWGCSDGDEGVNLIVATQHEASYRDMLVPILDTLMLEAEYSKGRWAPDPEGMASLMLLGKPALRLLLPF